MTTIRDIDNLDDRREIRRLLDFIPPFERWQYLQWVARLPMKDGSPQVDVTFDATDREQTRRAVRGCDMGDRYVSNSVYRLVFMIASQYSLDWHQIETQLVGLARGRIEARNMPEFDKIVASVRAKYRPIGSGVQPVFNS